MNDLDLLAELGSETRLPDLAELRAQRARLTAAIDAETAAARMGGVAGYGPRTRLPIGRGRRGRWLAASAVVVATAAAVAALIVTGGPPRHATPRPGSPGTAVQLTAYQILDRAAAAALNRQAVIPRPDQFVYAEVSAAGGGVIQSWLSVNGKHDGLVEGVKQPAARSACARTQQTVGKGSKSPQGMKTKPNTAGLAARAPQVVTGPCTPEPAYFPDMPTTPGAMLSWLESHQMIPLDLGALSKELGGILTSHYLLPAQRAALFELLTRTPGLTVVRNVRDIAGRPGVGIEATFDGVRAVNIFDPHTFAYLGMTVLNPPGGQPTGMALLRIAIVDRPGQLP